MNGHLQFVTDEFDDVLADVLFTQGGAQFLFGGFPDDRPEGIQIGRASCRERV